jgi:nucleotide-binding universal stress UspA family protein
MKKILFPIDFSETAINAFVYALELAKIIKGELVLLHSFHLHKSQPIKELIYRQFKGRV